MPGDRDLIEVPGRRVFVPGQGAVTSGGAGVDNFLGLTDTPSSFTAGKYFRVNSGGTAIEEVDLDHVDRLLERHVIDIHDFTDGLAALVGTGTVTNGGSRGTERLRLKTGTTNPSSAQLKLRMPLSVNTSNGILSQVDWDKDVEFIWLLIDDRTGAASTRSAHIKVATSLAVGRLGSEGVGVEIQRNSLTFDCLSHDGTTVESTQVTKPSGATQWRLHIKHTAGSKVEFFLNGSLVATHTTRVPAGLTTEDFLFEVEQATGVALRLDILRMIVVQDWTT